MIVDVIDWHNEAVLERFLFPSRYFLFFIYYYYYYYIYIYIYIYINIYIYIFFIGSFFLTEEFYTQLQRSSRTLYLKTGGEHPE